jgi:Protein of unknown function (DUF2752)
VPEPEPTSVPVAPRARRAELWRPHTEYIGRFARILLGIMACGLIVVFGLAAWLRPYTDDGQPRSMATHTQLGMPPCTMVVLTGKPCPSCGMTTSFSLLMHGDVLNSLRANWVGTLLAIFWLGLIPWGLYGTIRGRLLWVRNAELFFTIATGVILVLMFSRWLWVITTR